MNFYLDDEMPEGAVLEFENLRGWWKSDYDKPVVVDLSNRRANPYRISLPDGTHLPVVFENRSMAADTAYQSLIRLNKDRDAALSEASKLRHENVFLRDCLDKVRKALP